MTTSQNDIKDMNAQYIVTLANQHHWAATGVSDYPPRDPLIGQGRFYRAYRNFIHTIDQESDNFAHVFAIEGEWGRGKSRLGHELIAQINDCSQGWFVRSIDQADAGQLVERSLFDTEEKQNGYLGLYIRYSQVASDYQNADNWFGYGVYRALTPLATGQFDGSIQSIIAKQSMQRLEALGFKSKRLYEALELEKNYTEEQLYEDKILISRLANQAFAYLQPFGIKQVLVVLDELETVAEAATYGLEEDDAKRLDGQAIRLIGRAIKEEDQRKTLPWLRYVALCSPLLGQQLREIQSTARRFELVELEHNAFADISDYVARLKTDRRLQHDYPSGLVEAAYTMSGANFGWFNVIMSQVDAYLTDLQTTGKPIPATGELFNSLLEYSTRIRKYVLDHQAIGGIQTGDHDLLDHARTLLFGQLPMALAKCAPRLPELLHLNNEDENPVASLYRKVEWDALDCRRALEKYKFYRDPDNREEWLYPSIDQSIRLEALLRNLQTFSINEVMSSGHQQGYLIPLNLAEFRHLVNLIYSHPAAETVADALWFGMVDSTPRLPESDGTHIGPSIAMLRRLDIRYGDQQKNTLLFKDSDHNDTHKKAMVVWDKALASDPLLRNQTRLCGLFRLIDKHWLYEPLPLPNSDDLVILQTQKAERGGRGGGLVHCEGLKLHPGNMALFAWVNNVGELGRLHQRIIAARNDTGRVPVVAFTSQIPVVDAYSKDTISTIQSDMLLYQLTPTDADSLERIGLPTRFCSGLEINDRKFTKKFHTSLENIRHYIEQEIHNWRGRLNDAGLIAWPLKPSGRISDSDRELLIKAWKLLAIDEPGLNGLAGLTGEHSVDAAEVRNLMGRLTASGQYGYDKNEQAGLFTNLENPAFATAEIPPFLARILCPGKTAEWTLEKAKKDWYWGYLWSGSGLSAKTVYDDWMKLASELNLLQLKQIAGQNRDLPWQTVPLSALESAIDEATNWLTGDQPGCYKQIVTQFETVYGTGLISHLFSSTGSEGTQTTAAREALKAAGQLYDELERSEQTLDSKRSLQEIAVVMQKTIKARNDIVRLVNSVKPTHEKQWPQTNQKALKLDNSDVPLAIRIRDAKLFADQVLQCKTGITGQVNQLIETIRDDIEASPPFPRQLYTLSLESINNILQGSLDLNMDSETARHEAGGSTETLHHFLRDLNIQKAQERLEILSHEVGYDFYNGSRKPLSEIDGYIISSYRNFKKRFQEQLERLESMKQRTETLLETLTPLPVDYPDQTVNATLVGYKEDLLSIADMLEDLDSQAQREREAFRRDGFRGQFSAIRDIPERLIKPFQDQLAIYGGQLRTRENQLAGYRKALLEAANGQLIDSLNPLFRSCGQDEIKTLQLSDIDQQSLHDTHVMIDHRTITAKQKADDLLSGTHTTLDQWLFIAQDLLEGRQPSMTFEQKSELESRGILKSQVTFGG